MLCTTCGRDSANRRVCPFCFTPYPAPGDANSTSLRRSGSSQRASTERSLTETLEHAARDSRAFVMRQTPLVRWAGLGIAVVLLIWAFTGGDDGPGAAPPAGTVVDEVLAPITREQAIAHIQDTRTSALVEVNNDEVFVSFAAATFPLQEAGQLRLVQRFVQADELVEGKKRRIYFYTPNGRLFAQADAITGLTIK